MLILVPILALGSEYISRERYQILAGKRSDGPQRTNPSKLSQKIGFKVDHLLKNNEDFIPNQGRALDLFLGKWADTVFLAQKGLKVVGTQGSRGQLKELRQMEKEFGLSLETVDFNYKNAPFKNGSFNLIFANEPIEANYIPKVLSWVSPKGVFIYKCKELKELNSSCLGPVENFKNFKIVKLDSALKKEDYSSLILIKN